MPTLQDQGIAGNWTFNGKPDANDRDWMRVTIGDYIDHDQLVSDEMIAAAITDAGDRGLAAYRLVMQIAARFSREADVTTNDGAGNSRTKALSQRAGAFLKLAKQLLDSGIVTTTIGPVGMPYAGGISVGDKESQLDDTDRVQPAFTVGMSDYR